jgi:hypothetical protein
MGARPAHACSRPLSPARPGTVLTWAGTHSCRPPPSGNIPGGQGVAGSNPAVPTGNRLFSNILPLGKSQQKSQLVVQRPLHRPAPRVRRRPTRTCAKTAEQASSPVKAPKITEPPRICTTTPDNCEPIGPIPTPLPHPAHAHTCTSGQERPIQASRGLSNSMAIAPPRPHDLRHETLGAGTVVPISTRINKAAKAIKVGRGPADRVHPQRQGRLRQHRQCDRTPYSARHGRSRPRGRGRT